MTSGWEARSGADVVIEGAEDSVATKRLGDVDALEPPDPAVAPVAPLASDRGLASGFLGAGRGGDPVTRAIGIGDSL